MLARQTSLTFLSPFITTQRKNLTKTCRGKVMKEKLNYVKTKNYFLLPNSSFRHRLGFALQNLRVDRAKGYVSPPQT